MLFSQRVSDKALHAGFYAVLAGTYVAATRGRCFAVTPAVFAYSASARAASEGAPPTPAEAFDLAATP